MKHKITALLILFAAALNAAVPIKWQVESSRAKPAQFEAYRGEELALEAELLSYGAALTNGLESAALYWQTNGMGSVYWTAPASVTSNLLSATWSPTNDVGATFYNCFIGAPGSNYRAAFRLRMLPAPGAVPSELDLPTKSIDFDQVTILNAPYYTKTEVEEKIVELAPAPGNYAAVSNAAMTALQSSDIPTIEGYALGNLGDNINITNYDGYIDIIPSLLRSGNFVGGGSAPAPSTTTFYGWSLGISEGFWDEFWDDIYEYAQISNGTVVIGDNSITPITTETDPTVPAWAKASTKPSYTASEIGAYTTQEVDEAIAAAEPGDYATVSNAAVTAAAGVTELETTTSLIYTLYAGSNVVFEVTNYDSQVHMPTARLLSLTATNTYDVVWTETNGLVTVAKAATNYTDAAILAATNRYALRGWSATTSGLGADAPAETTWVSTPTFVIAGGYEYQKVVTTAGEVWVLTSNGMTMATNGLGYFDISSGDGESIFRIEKTDSYTVGADADNITVSGNTVTISVPVVSASHPYLQYAATLNGTWYDELDGTLPNTISAAWSGSSGAWVCTVTTTATSGFFSFYYSQEGSTKIINNGMTDLSGGIYFNGVKYVPTVSGTELKFIAE